ncbi:hypothetical protein [Brevundimonas sp. LjRoot202]|uniref:hypothetical protein n=1 Tax=Brevundimonas sp. LjRoot202 TaxID=3342281 RepID=UPI003ECCE9F6
MRRASTLAAAAFAATGLLTLADAASAQSASGAGEARGLRYLSWPGRDEAADPADRQAARPAATRADLRRPNRVIPHGGFASAEPPPQRGLTPAPGSAPRTLTPANAWLRPPVAPASAPLPPSPSATTPPPRPGPEYLPDQGGHSQPTPAEVVYPAPVSPDEAAPVAASSDPMAPRRDAAIFRMQQEAAPARPAAEVAATGEPQSQDGGRYYSVHRQNGREPDALVIPAPTYVDALVVSSIDTLASQDLAEPEQGPTLIRDRNGNVRAAPAASDGDHQ